MRTLFLGPSVELPAGHDPREGRVEIGGGDGLRILPLGPCVKFFVGHDPREGRAGMGGGAMRTLSLAP